MAAIHTLSNPTRKCRHPFGPWPVKMMQRIRRLARRIVLLFNRINFYLFFTRIPRAGKYCNSKLISVSQGHSLKSPIRPFLVFIRSGGGCRLIDDGERNFDIALNLYACSCNRFPTQYEYLVAGGINKYKAAYQFLDSRLLGLYQGFMFLDDDLEMTYSELSGFLVFCRQHNFHLAQPSLSHHSYYSHGHVLNVPGGISRPVHMVEVMCPYFSADAIKSAISTFNLSYSTWGLDHLWPNLPGLQPVVVDAFTITHTKPMQPQGAFYKYMRKIGVSPRREELRLRNEPLAAKLPNKPASVSELTIGTDIGTGKQP